MLPPEFINEVKEKNDITDVIGGYVTLKRSGRISKGLCPFHSEKTPSFMVYGDTSSFYCFGCQTGGDVVTFISKIENLDYIEAVKFLANRAGMTLPEEGRYDGLSHMRMRIREQNREAGRFFYRALYSPAGKQALAYFHTRGLTDEIIRRFGLGWSPDGWDELVRHLNGLGFKRDEILAADLGFNNKSGRLTDRFRNRVMFPIIDLQGNVVGFGGRRFTEDAFGGKYVNTGDTLIYKKTNHLFAMNLAKNSKTRELILCEGYMDVIALHQAGFTNAVAALGTAVTQPQAKLLHRYADRVVLSQDGDEAGQKSIARSIPIMKAEGLDVRVLTLTGAKDPDEFIRRFGPERFKRLLEGSSNDIEYSLTRISGKYDISTDDGRLHFLREACEYLSGLGSLEREVYAGRIADKLHIEKSAVLSQAAASARRREQSEKAKEFREMAKTTAGVGSKVNPERSANLRASNAEYALIRMLFSHQEMIHRTAEKLPTEVVVTDFGRRIYQAFIEMNQDGQEITVSLLSQRFSPEELSEIVRVINGNGNFDGSDLDTLIRIIETEHETPKPQDAANLTEDELLKQMSLLKKKKK